MWIEIRIRIGCGAARCAAAAHRRHAGPPAGAGARVTKTGLHGSGVRNDKNIECRRILILIKKIISIIFNLSASVSTGAQFTHGDICS
ncbi:hypothetical protein [Acidovorax sp. SUPP3334]|uniref:hypothetical protein n=1 Tax=Acidovorax sp. SUPP3334 TaxID=2920881 RepID=UPI0024E16E9E|nr:hypothetical protein [Acidovorax sp. SUPP3334]